MDVELQHRIAWILYNCERERAERCATVLTLAAGKSVKDMMEPWEEAKDAFLSDAAAVLRGIATPEAAVA